MIAHPVADGQFPPCAFNERDSRGRRYPEPDHPYRSIFQRDRDRVVHARAFRRLENKTQVFSQRFSDHFRNRLTHTLEVAQISRTVARALGLNQDLVEALALAHDLGHPPFGHAGEAALDACMRQRGLQFDHNLQALRIVEQLELRYAAFRGLNLSFEVREGMVKHSHDYQPDEHPELAEYELGLRPPLEAQLIDLTDEISYGGADLDDGFEAHLLTLEEAAEAVPRVRDLLAEVDARYGALDPKLRFNEMLRRLLDYLISDLIATVAARLPALDSVAAVRRLPGRVTGFSPGGERDRQTLKAYLSERLYRHPRMLAENRRAAATVTAVFERLAERPDLLPPAQRRAAARQPVARVVCDYVAGMTDSYLMKQHQTLGLA
ncbi:MAG: deoxyguanosinetriphosphate triphosphohydrolase [Terriglobales bacterium]